MANSGLASYKHQNGGVSGEPTQINFSNGLLALQSL